jgi:hypothetical protein
MDSIERMRRINDLTRELKQHGFADSSFEAIKQANQIYGDDALEDNVKNGLIEKSAHERIVKDENMGDDSVSYADRKIGKLTESVDTLTSKMNEIIKAINDLDSRLTELKIKQDKMAVARIEPRIEPRVEQREEPRVERAESRVERTESRAESVSNDAPKNEPKRDEYSMNQRTGTFQSQDVAIDKMFYFGNKKS